MTNEILPDWVRKALPDAKPVPKPFASGGVVPNTIPEVEGGEYVINRLGHYARPAAALRDYAHRLTPDEIIERVAAWRNAAPDILEIIKQTIDEGFRKGPRKELRAFYRHGVYEYFKNVGRKPYEWYVRHGELRGAYNERAGIWAAHAVK